MVKVVVPDVAPDRPCTPTSCTPASTFGTVKGMRAPPLASAVAVATGSVAGKTKRESISPGWNPEAVATTFVPTGPWRGLSDSVGPAAVTVKPRSWLDPDRPCTDTSCTPASTFGTVKGMRAPPLPSAVAVATGSVAGKTKRESISPGWNPEAVATTLVPTEPWRGLSDSGGCTVTVKVTNVVIWDGVPCT